MQINFTEIFKNAGSFYIKKMRQSSWILFLMYNL